MASELIKHVSDASFEADVLQPGTPVLVDYWAEWCGPCKMIAPILDEVAGAYQGKLQIAVQKRPAGSHQGGRHEQGPADSLHRPTIGLMRRRRPKARSASALFVRAQCHGRHCATAQDPRIFFLS